MIIARVLLLVLLLIVQTAVAAAPAAGIAAAVTENRWMPQFGKQLESALAYQLQFEAVNRLLAGKLPDGFKAGLTSSAAQQKFSVEQPVAGVLLADSQLGVDSQGDYVFAMQSYLKPMLEIEIGFRFANKINAPIADVESLKKQVSSIFPVIELPDLGFKDMQGLSAADIIANNVVARKYILGLPVPPTTVAMNRLQVQLYRNEKLILTGQGSDAMGDQWQALLWLVNQTIANGWEIAPGQVGITGALGKMLPVQPGTYRADFAELGTIVWRVQ